MNEVDPKFKAKILEEISDLTEEGSSSLPDHVSRLIDKMLVTSQGLNQLTIKEQQLLRAHQEAMLAKQNQEVALAVIRDLVVEEYLLCQGAEVHVITGGGGVDDPSRRSTEQARAAAPPVEKNA